MDLQGEVGKVLYLSAFLASKNEILQSWNYNISTVLQDFGKSLYGTSVSSFF